MKRKLLKLLLPAFLFISSGNLQAQSPGSRYDNLEDLLESLTEETDEGEGLTSWIEELQELHEHPVSVNTAGLDELLKIPFLNEITASSILEYRSKFGAFLSVYEIASVPGIGRDLAEKISFFISTDEEVQPAKKDSVYKRKGNHQLLVRSWETFPLAAGYKSKGEKPTAYLGSPQTVYVRYQYEKTDFLQAGLTADKDAGEPFFKGSNPYGFDFYSGHLSFRINKFIPQVIIGDFTARTGQGLVLWQGFSLGKTSDVMQASKNMSQIRPYTSTDENNFFRGVATTFRLKNCRLNLFLSSKKSDGNLALADDSTIFFTSLQTSGYHRTISETEDKKSVRHTVAGILFDLLTHHTKIGINGLYERFQFPYDPGDQLYEKFLLRGNENYNLSVDYHWVTGKYHLFGEAAISKSKGIAFTNGIEAHLHDQLALTLSYRHFDKDYHATWADAFAADPNAIGETGWYAGIRLLPAPKISLSAYADWYRWPWIKYSTSSPSEGFSYLLEAEFKMNRRVTGNIIFKNRTGEQKSTGENLSYNTVKQSENLRIQTKFNINRMISLCWRLELNRVINPDIEKGILIFQDFAWTSGKFPLSAVFRVSWFHTASFNSRIYAYENDLLYAFSTFAFYGEGFRTYLKLKYSLMKNLDAWFKIANTWYPGQETISSENSELAGNIKTEVKIQIRYRF